MVGVILPVAMVPWLFLGVQFTQKRVLIIPEHSCMFWTKFPEECMFHMARSCLPKVGLYFCVRLETAGTQWKPRGCFSIQAQWLWLHQKMKEQKKEKNGFFSYANLPILSPAVLVLSLDVLFPLVVFFHPRMSLFCNKPWEKNIKKVDQY